MEQISPQQTPYDRLTPSQQEDYDKAVYLAHSANKSFDDRKEEAELLADARMRADETDNESDWKDENMEQKEFRGWDEEVHTYKKAADVLMPPRAAFDSPKSTDKHASSTDDKLKSA